MRPREQLRAIFAALAQLKRRVGHRSLRKGLSKLHEELKIPKLNARQRRRLQRPTSEDLRETRDELAHFLRAKRAELGSVKSRKFIKRERYPDLKKSVTVGGTVSLGGLGGIIVGSDKERRRRKKQALRNLFRNTKASISPGIFDFDITR